MSVDPKQMQFVKSARSQLRNGDREFRATKHSRLDMFEESVRRTESLFDRLLDMPIVQAALLVAACAAVIGTVAALLGWRP